MRVFCDHCREAVELVAKTTRVTCNACQRDFVADVGHVAWFESRYARVNFALDRPSVVIGRGPTCDFRLDSGRVSREHARVIERDDGQWGVFDLGSSGGTFLQVGAAPMTKAGGSEPRNTVLEDGVYLHPLEITFRTGVFPRVHAHHAPLDAAAEDPAAWQVWADQLLERHDPLGLWLIEPHAPDTGLCAMSAALVSPNESRTIGEWNDFGFLSSLTIEGGLLLERPRCCDARHVPASRYLTRLVVRPRSEEERTACLARLRELRLPASLRTLEVEGASPAAITALRHEVRARCAHLLL
jgi:hypothetical protein